jgi:type II secretory pathway predicted ATPase ExeA
VYEAHFGLLRRPFSKTPDPAFLYEGKQHGEALARLELACEDRDIALLTGEIGAGKTTVSRALIDRLDERFRVVLVINPRLSATQVLGLVADRLGIEKPPRGKAKLLDALTERLYELYQSGHIPLIIVDEAQLIPSKSVFEELRLLTNLQLDDAPLVSLLLIGQPELRAKLSRKGYESFAQRIGMAYHLGPLDEGAVGAYIAHRLRVAGREAPLFDEGAVRAVASGSYGIPRRINTICQSALLVAFGEGKATVDAASVEDVLLDLETHLGPMFRRPKAPPPLAPGSR